MYRTQATSGLPVIFLRYNPDAFKVDGETLRTGKKVRHDFLAAQITEALAWQPQETGEMVRVLELFYDRETAPGQAKKDTYKEDVTTTYSASLQAMIADGRIETVAF